MEELIDSEVNINPRLVAMNEDVLRGLLHHIRGSDYHETLTDELQLELRPDRVMDADKRSLVHTCLDVFTALSNPGDIDEMVE